MTAHGDVLRRQDDLQVEAQAVIVDLQLDELLGRWVTRFEWAVQRWA